jgi:Ca2+-binding RTX toxin-like protein
MFRPSLESLETRDLMSVTSSFLGGVLTLTGDPGSAHNVLVRPSPVAPTAISVLADGVNTNFLGVNKVNYTGGVRGDTFTNRTPVAGTLSLGDGNNVVYTAAPSTVVTVGNGSNILQVVGGKSTITAGNGNDNIYGGVADSITAGSGQDIIYDILPGTTTITVAPHTAVDHLFTGPQTTLSGAMAQDHTAQFFVTGRTLGSGTLALQGQTLYFTANNNGDQFYVFPAANGGLTVLYNLNDGTGPKFAQFAPGQVNQIAAFGGAGNDTFINQTNIDDVMYGAGGGNTLIGGFGSLDLEKAGGAANQTSFVYGRSPVYNDLNGSATAGITSILAGTPGAFNVFRSNSPSDVIFSPSVTDVIVSLFPDQPARVIRS